MVAVELTGVTVRKNGVDVVRDLDLTADPGRVLGLVGPSGSGKTSVLRAVAGLDPMEAGTVRFDGDDVSDTAPGKRNVAMVFEVPALYPNRSVRGNIAFPLEMRHDAVDVIRERVGAEARALRIEALLAEKPKRLSAGESHVVQVARAMVRNPAVLLLDEPFANLDVESAVHLRREVLLLQRGFGATTLLATNDPIDAMTMADRLAVVERGSVTQVGAPLDVYRHPATVAAAVVTGEADVLAVRVDTDHDGSWLEHPGFRLRAWQPALRRHSTRRLQLVVRPEWWQLDEHGPVTVDVERVHRWGSTIVLWCRAHGVPMTVKLRSPMPRVPQIGDRVTLRLDRYVLIDPIDGFELDLS